MKRHAITLTLLIILTSIGLYFVWGQERAKRVPLAVGVQLAENQIVGHLDQIKYLRGVIDGWKTTNADSVEVPPQWTEGR